MFKGRSKLYTVQISFQRNELFKWKIQASQVSMTCTFRIFARDSLKFQSALFHLISHTFNTAFPLIAALGALTNF